MSTAEAKSTGAAQLVTADELFHKYNGQRCELIEGIVEHMSPIGFGHGSFERRIAQLLGAHVDQHELGEVVAGEVGFIVSHDPDSVLAPDIAYVRKERLDAIGTTEKYFPEAPTLAVEIVSPSDTAEAVDSKARRWLAAGTEAVWVVFPRGKSVTVYQSLDNIQILTVDHVLDGGEVIRGFALPVREIFAGLT